MRSGDLCALAADAHAHATALSAAEAGSSAAPKAAQVEAAAALVRVEALVCGYERRDERHSRRIPKRRAPNPCGDKEPRTALRLCFRIVGEKREIAKDFDRKSMGCLCYCVCLPATALARPLFSRLSEFGSSSLLTRIPAPAHAYRS